MSELKAIPIRNPDSAVIRSLETALERAKTGELIGILLLENHQGDTYGICLAGEMSMGVTLLTFEDWKHTKFMQRNWEVK